MELSWEDCEVECGIPRLWFLLCWVWGETEIRPDGAADVDGAGARSVVQPSGMVAELIGC